MQSVTESSRRKYARLGQLSRQLPSLGSDWYRRKASEPLHALTRHMRITPRRLIQRHRRDHEIEVLRCFVPPPSSHGLVGAHRLI